MQGFVDSRPSAILFALTLLFATAPVRAEPTSGDQPPSGAAAAEQVAPESWSLHAQATNITQYHPAFTSPFRGPNSLDPGHRGNETIDATLYAGLRLWDGLEAYVNPEVDQGFGLSDTTGVAGYVNGEGSKVGAANPYIRLHRAFFRYTLGLGGTKETIEADANQLAGTRDADNIVFTVGKFSVIDIFDDNAYAHDSKSDFLNWSIIDAGAFDYPADAWGYTYGGVAEWTQAWWTLRTSLVDLSREPNGKALERGFKQFGALLEAEERHEVFGQPGKFKVLFFANHGRMADYNDAVRLARQTGTTPDVGLVRRYNTRTGIALNLEQQVTGELGFFARASLNDGHKEAYEFTDINRSIAGGLSLKGDRWQRPKDKLGVAGVINDISKDARNYFAAGGLGILIGDGQLPRAGFEKIIELYYNAAIIDGVNLSVDYQHIDNPAYDAARGPVSVFGLRVHLAY